MAFVAEHRDVMLPVNVHDGNFVVRRLPRGLPEPRRRRVSGA
jgi:hypothetical protein